MFWGLYVTLFDMQSGAANARVCQQAIPFSQCGMLAHKNCVNQEICKSLSDRGMNVRRSGPWAYVYATRRAMGMLCFIVLGKWCRSFECVLQRA